MDPPNRSTLWTLKTSGHSGLHSGGRTWRIGSAEAWRIGCWRLLDSHQRVEERRGVFGSWSSFWRSGSWRWTDWEWNTDLHGLIFGLFVNHPEAIYIRSHCHIVFKQDPVPFSFLQAHRHRADWRTKCGRLNPAEWIAGPDEHVPFTGLCWAVTTSVEFGFGGRFHQT